MTIKNLILTFLFCAFTCTLISATSEEEKKIKAEIWNNAPSEFKVTSVPQKWENESAVIIATSLDYVGDYATRMQGLNVVQFYVVKVTSHHRVKLLDKAAVKEYSELTFNEKFVNKNFFGKSNSYFIIAVKIIKANGTEKEIDLDKAVKADSDSKKDLKIAIPDLEPGDIIDYFSTGKEEYVGWGGDIDDNFLFEGEYPVMKRTMRFKLPQQYKIESKVYNGAPDFNRIAVDKDVIFSLEDSMREKAQDILWTYRHRTSPEIRYKVQGAYSTTSAKTTAHNFINGFGYNTSDIGFIMDYMNQNMKKEKDLGKLVNETFYLLRNPIYLQAYFNIEQGRPLSVNYVNDQFFSVLSKYFIKNKISHNIMVLPSRDYGTFEEQLSLNGDAVIRVNLPTPIFLKRLKPFAIPNEFSYEYEGMQAVMSKTYPKVKGEDLNYSEFFIIPVSTADNNITTTTLNVTLNSEDNSKIDIKRKVVVKGHSKEGHQYMVVTNYDYLKEYDQPRYQAESSHLIGTILKQYNKEKEKLEQRLTQDYNERDKKLKEDIESSMDVKVGEYKNFKLTSIGMWDYAPNTEYSDEFTIENLTKKAGPNYILELAKLIEKQTEVSEKAKKRDRDIHMNYARKFATDIFFTIPDGYTIEGLENLNKEIVNKTGGFVSTATIQGNVLKISCIKYYSENYFPASEWNKMIDFLNPAGEFTRAKILLKKK